MPDRIRELRALIGTTANKTYVAASNAAWAAGTAYVLPITAIDVSKLVHQGIESKVLTRRMHEAPAAKEGLSASELPISIPLGMGSADTTAPFEATLLSAFFGGLASPTVKTHVVAASPAPSATGWTSEADHGLSPGMAVLVNGEVRRVATCPTTTSLTLEMALSAAPAHDDVVVNSHTVYLDPTATQSYLDLLGIGYHAEDQFQCLRCMGPVKFSGLGAGEEPSMDLALTVPQWQEVPAADRDQLEPSTAPNGSGQAPTSRALGGFFMGDWGSTTRAAVESADWSIDPGLQFVYKADANYENRMGACKRVGGKVSGSITVYIDLDYGLHADFPATDKQMLWQFGNTAQACVAITIPRARLKSKPVRKSINNCSGLGLEFWGAEPTVGSTPDNCYSSAFSAHWF